MSHLPTQMRNQSALMRKFELLEQILVPYLRAGLIVTFSGGVDSAFLLWTAHKVFQERAQEIGPRGGLIALTTLSASMAQIEREDAKKFSSELGVEHLWLESEEIKNPQYLKNDANRCYYCKSELFSKAKEVARSRGYGFIAYGYNASDQIDERPGHRAAQENEILFPLAEVGLTKDEIRLLMRIHGLALSDKPASPCLSSRVMRGVTITEEKLNDIEEIEVFLRKRSLKIFRVRLHEETAGKKWLRLEVDPSQMDLVLKMRDELIAYGLKRGYQWVTLDLNGYQVGGANRI